MTAERRQPAATTPAEEHRRAMHRAVDRILDAWPRAHDDAQAVGFPAGRGYDSAGGGRSGFLVDVDGEAEFVPATGVELAALNVTVAVAWLAELHDVIEGLCAAVWPGRAFSLVWTPTGLSGRLHEAVERVSAEWTLDDLIDTDPRSPNHRRDVFGLYRLADAAGRYWPAPVRKGERAGTVTVGERTNTVDVCVACGEPIIGGRADPLKRIDGDPFHVKNPAGIWCYHQALRSRGRLGNQGRKEAS